MVLMVAAHIQYVASALEAMRERRLASSDVKREVQAGYNRERHARLARTLWATGGCRSW